MFARIAVGFMIGILGGPAVAQEAAVLARLPDSSLVATCSAPAPAAGTSFSGPVMQVLEDDRLCIALGPTPDQWIAVRPTGITPASVPPREQARAVMMATTFARRLDCVAGSAAADAVSAVCTLGGAPLVEGIRAVSASMDWQAWR